MKDNNAIIIDLDGTLCELKRDGQTYANVLPKEAVVRQLRAYKQEGFSVVIFSARNMRTYGGDVELIRAHTLPGIIAWLTKHDIPYDEVLIGKPWPGPRGFYVDDRTVRPDEFARLTPEELRALVGDE